MLRMLFAMVRSRIVWVAISAATVAGAAFVFTVALASAVVIAARGQDADPDELAAVATLLGLVVTAVAVAAMAVVWRARVRRWLPAYEAMLCDAARLKDTYLVETVTPPDRAAGGHMVAADLHTGVSRGLWLPDLVLPRGAVDVHHPDCCRATGPIVDDAQTVAGRVRARLPASAGGRRAPSASATRWPRNTSGRPPGRLWPPPNSSCASTAEDLAPEGSSLIVGQRRRAMVHVLNTCAI